VEFTNPTTGLAVTSNAEVGGELSVSGDVEMSSNLTVSGGATVSGNVGVGTTEPTETLDIVGNLNLQKVSNTASIKLNSNVVTEYTRSKNLIKYPRVAMTQNDESSTTGYVASASGVPNPSYDSYHAFNNITANGSGSWHSENSYATSGSRESTTTTLSSWTGGGGGHNGAWLKIKLPQKIKLTSILFKQRPGYPGQHPRLFSIVGSNDDSTWYLVHEETTRTFSTATGPPNPDTHTMSGLYANMAWKYFAVVIKTGATDNTYDHVAIGDWELFGVLEYDPDAHGTDVITRSVPNVPNTDWLEVYWDGQDYTSMPSTVTDKSGNEVIGTPSGGVGFDTEYKAFTFDGVDDKITGTLNNPAGDWTHSTSFWFKFDVVGSIHFYSIGPNTSSGQNVTALYYNTSGYLQTSVSGGVYTRYENVFLLPNIWYHITTVKRTNAQDSIYLNGNELSVTDYGNTGSQMSLPANTSLNIGGRPDQGSFFDGSIANFRLFNRALSADEAWQLYAYQKEYFDVSPDVVTFKGGRLGIGTSEPRAVLDVRGNFYSPGSVIQLQTRTFCLSYNTTSTTFADTGAYVDITPKFNNSKLFVLFDGLVYINSNSACGMAIRGFRSIGGGTDQRVYSAIGLVGSATTPHDLSLYQDPGGYLHSRISLSFSDIPNTSSSIRYKIYAKAHVSGQRVYLGNGGHQPLTFSVFEIAQ